MLCPTCEGTGEYQPRGFVSLAEMERLVKKGLSYQKVADALNSYHGLNVSKSKVYYYSHKYGWRGRFRPELITNLEARDALAQRDISET